MRECVLVVRTCAYSQRAPLDTGTGYNMSKQCGWGTLDPCGARAVRCGAHAPLPAGLQARAHPEPRRGRLLLRAGQGLTLVHFSAQTEPFLI